MDFKDFINQIKELADPAVFAIIAKLAIAFYFLKLLFKGFKASLKFIFAIKEKSDNYEEMQNNYKEWKKINLENKEEMKEIKESSNKANLANQERDLKTHETLEFVIAEIKNVKTDLNAYKSVKHSGDTEITDLKLTVKLAHAVLEKIDKKL